MLTFAYDDLSHNEDWTRVTARPNCQVWDGPGSAYDRRYGCGILLPLSVLDVHRFRCERTDLLVQRGGPFVYPLELRSTVRESLLRNPDLAPGFPKSVAERASAGHAVILIWIGHEPVPFHLDLLGRMWVFDLVQNFIRQYDLPPQQVWLVSGNMLAGPSHESWRRSRGLPEQHTFRFCTLVMAPSSVRIHYEANQRGETLSLVEENDVWTATLEPLSAAEFAERYLQPAEIAEERRTGRLRPKRFLAMNRQPRAHRQILVSYLSGKGLLEDSLVSFGGAPAASADLREFRELGTFLQESWRALQPRLPLIIDDAAVNVGINFYRVPFGWPYRESYINIVTETEVARDVAPICTEKLIKPMLNLQPFIAITTANTLDTLRNLGFKTFAPGISEDYDAIDDPEERLLRLLAEIDRLGALTQSAVRDLYFDCLAELEHNRAHLLEASHPVERLWSEIEGQLG